MAYVCAIFKSDNMTSNISLASGSSSARYLNAVALCNIKQSVNAYGGNSYSAVQNSVYITTGASAELVFPQCCVMVAILF